MEIEELVRRRQDAAEEFNRHEHRADGEKIAESLCGGLTTLRTALFIRVHGDIQSRFGMDSSLSPGLLDRAQQQAKIEIELYQIAIACVTARQHGYVADGGRWFQQWLSRLRLGALDLDEKILKRIAFYCCTPPDSQRLAFTDVLARAAPGSRRAPLVLFRLMPPAVRIATSLAFGDHVRAMELRREQAVILPAIRDCSVCHGKLLDNGELCRTCGNPLWHFDWLTAAD